MGAGQHQTAESFFQSWHGLRVSLPCFDVCCRVVCLEFAWDVLWGFGISGFEGVDIVDEAKDPRLEDTNGERVAHGVWAWEC